MYLLLKLEKIGWIAKYMTIQNNQPSSPNSQYPVNSGIEYLNSISTPPQTTQMPNDAPVAEKKWKNIYTILIATFILLITLILILANINSGSSDNTPTKTDNDSDIITAEEHTKEETLNEELANLVENDPHREYVSPNDLSFNCGMVPEEVILEFNIDIENPDFSSAISVPAMNSNILNYYLDQKSTIVAIVEPSGIVSLNKKTTTLYIYASVPSNYDFIGFNPSDFNSDGTSKEESFLPEEKSIYFSRSELFNQLTPSSKFYVIKKTENLSESNEGIAV